MAILDNQTILITRDISQSGGLRDILEENGATVISIPTIKISEPPDWKSFDQSAADIRQFDWIVFSSVNAVTKTAERLRYLGLDLPKRDRPKLAAVGDQTAKAAEDLGWAIDLVPSFFQAEGLLDAFQVSDIQRKKFWFPRALTARNKIIKTLEKSGAEVVLSPVYQNVPPMENKERLRQAIFNEKLDWITFTSSSTVTNFFMILGESISRSELPKLASIGTITTKTLTDYDLTPAFTANPQNIQGLCQGILDWR